MPERSFFRVAVLLTLAAFPFVPTANAQAGGSTRAPFVLELPDVSPERFTFPIVRIAARDVPRLKIRVLDPYAEKISYGTVIITLNGDGINRGCSQTRDMEGKIFTCGKREDRLGGYEINPGKNILELKATDNANHEYYASYVLLLGDRAGLSTYPFGRPTAAGAAEPFSGRKFAVIVGVSEYEYNDAGLQNLEYADADAQAVFDFLRTPEGGGFFPSDIKLLLNRDASLVAIRSALNEVSRRAGHNDMVFIFIAGHGAPDPLSSQNLYFLLYDTKVVDMEKTAFRMDELKRYLDTQVIADRVLVMIDTCHSAGVNQKTHSLVTGRQLTQTGDENNISNFYLTKQLFKEKGRSIMTSSDVNEVSREGAKWGNHGVFTWALLEGLKGKADLNGDHFITTGELFQFTRASVQQATNFEQNPIAMPGSATNVALAVVTKKP